MDHVEGTGRMEEAARARDEVTEDLPRVTLSAEQQLEGLSALCTLDAEAAAAYVAAAEIVEDEAMRQQLLSFAADHRRHVDELNRVIEAQGGRPIEENGVPPLLARLATFAGAVAPEAAVLALLANEEVTNAAYDTALHVNVDVETAALLSRNFADELRHLDWIHDALHAMAGDDGTEQVIGHS